MLTLASTRGASMLPAFLLMLPSPPLWSVHAFVQAVYSAQTNLSVICQLAPIRLGYMCHLWLTFICIQCLLLWLFNMLVISYLISDRKAIWAWNIYEYHSLNENVEAMIIHSTLPEASWGVYIVYLLHTCTMHLSSTSCISRISSILYADLGKLHWMLVRKWKFMINWMQAG